MSQATEEHFFGSEKISRILLKITPPVMLAQLIQALYNIVDSFFVGQYSADALTALSVIFPLQLIIIALAVGTGVGVNTYMASLYAAGKPRKADDTAGTGMVLAILTWLIFAAISFIMMKPYVMTSASSPQAIADGVSYGSIVCIGSLGIFLESCWSKVHQAQGNMHLPMMAQIAGAAINIILDPILIFGWSILPEMGASGAALATVLGQVIAAVITGIGGRRKPPKPAGLLFYAQKIYYYGYSSILMQGLYTVYIVALNIILAGFSDAAVTVLGLYYKLQTFFFIPLFALQTCIVPVLSFNYTRRAYARCRSTVNFTVAASSACMCLAAASFIFLPTQMISFFSDDAQILAIGLIAFPIIGTSFVPTVFSLTPPVFFQAIGRGKTSAFLSLLRQIVCLIPIFWLLSLIGLNYTWLAFPVSEVIAGAAGVVLYLKTIKKWH